MTNLFTRPDTFFGVCEALGQDLVGREGADSVGVAFDSNGRFRVGSGTKIH